MDETTKIKELKELEEFEQKARRGKDSKTTILLSFSIILLVICMAIGVSVGYALIRPNPTAVIPDVTQTASPSSDSDSFHLSLSSLSITIPTDSSATLSFMISRTGNNADSMCTGTFKIIDLSQVHKLYEERYSAENDSVLDGILIGLTAYDEKTAHTIGDESPLFDGDKGLSNFNAGNEPDFLSVANRFTDGVNDWVVLNTIFLQKDGHQGGSSKGISESTYFQTESDLVGHSVDLIQRDIHNLTIQPDYYSFDVTWSYWEYTGPNKDTWIQFAPHDGTIAPSANQEIIVSFNSANLLPGIYNTDLLVDFGRGCRQPISIPAIMTVNIR